MTETDLSRDKEIESAINSLLEAGMPITISGITSHLTNYIVESYDGVTSLFVYKAVWIGRISNILNSMDIKFNKSRPNWERIAMLVHDKQLGIVHPVSEPTENFSNTRHTEKQPTENIASATEIISTSSTKKQVKLLPSDKTKIKEMFENLSLDKCWKLSTEVIVEEKMKEYAMSCSYEHPVHSLVLDTSDKIWQYYFTSEELLEIKGYEKKKLEDLPTVLETYLNSIMTSDSASLNNNLKQEQEHTACEWVRSTCIEYIKLFKLNYLPLTDQLEGDMMRRVWRFIDTAFDDSKIKCRGAEKVSKSSSINMNNDCTLSGVEKMERKLMGRKLDLIFFRQLLEYGCCECGRNDDQTKELYDGGFKMVKVLKEMLYTLCRESPRAVRDVTLVGFLLLDTKYTMVLCDSPAGFVCRINHTNTVTLPEEADDICNRLLPILKSVYQARLLMENTNKLVKKYPVEINVSLEENNLIPPSFTSEGSKNKRRRSSGSSDE